MSLGRFDTDSSALTARIDAHERFGGGDFPGWALGALGAKPGERVLDLGCGTGRQTLPLASAGCTVTAIDASGESLAAVRDAARDGGVAERVRTLQRRFDDLAPGDLDGGPYDRVISCYALYYATDPGRLLRHVAERLASGATVFVCGPSFANNAELRALHFGLAGTEPPGPTAAARFMEDEGPRLLADHVGEVQRLEFENRLRFADGEALHAYWSSYNLFDPALDDAFRAEAARLGSFETVKRVVGLRARA